MRPASRTRFRSARPSRGWTLSDFQLAKTGTVGAALTQVTPISGSVYNITVSGVSGSGTLGLDLVDDNSIRDLNRNPLAAINHFLLISSQQLTLPVGRR